VAEPKSAPDRIKELLEIAQSQAVVDGDYPLAVEIQNTINKHYGQPKDVMFTTGAILWLNGVLTRLRAKITELAEQNAVDARTYKITQADMKQVAQHVLTVTGGDGAYLHKILDY
jgi:hypothetical protein